MIVQFSAGNGGYNNTTPRGSATYYMPELEGRWYTISGLTTVGQTFNADGSVLVPGTEQFQPVRNCQMGVRDGAGQQHQQHGRAGRRRRAHGELRQRVRNVDVGSACRRDVSRCSCSASPT